MTRVRSVLIGTGIVAAACSALFGAYTYYYTDALTSINTSNWTENGTLTAGSGGLTSSNSNGGSLISKVAVPDGSSNYEVKTTLTLTQSGGTYVTYLRASSNAMSGPAAAGTTFAFEVQNPTFSGSACTATLAGYQIINAAVTALASTTIPCSNGVTIRAICNAVNQLAVYVNGILYFYTLNSSITSGHAGVGVRGAPAGNSIAQVQLGGMYVGNPVLPENQISASAFANKVELHWPGATEPNGPGIAFYEVFRNGTNIGDTNLDEGGFYDTGLSPSTTYTYWIIPYDYDLNGTQDNLTVTTPPSGAIDPRETGVRPTGSYWGGGGEQIDMLSGNLNYTTPILKAMGRGGWSVGFNLTYNSQNWRQDPAGTWQLGEDVGYGYGWKLLAGSLVALDESGWAVGEYLFTDATGAQYHLNVDTAGVWTSTESIYVYFNSNTGELHFNDGSFWVMGCTSAGTEWDAGTMYPTLMEDSNGNQVIINYADGVGVTWSNSSSRISTIEDVRGNGAHDYTFTYNTDAIPHLTGITNTIGTAENYSFAYTENYALDSPFNGQNFNTVALLKSSTVTGIPLTTYFSYDTTSATTSCTSVGTGTSGPGQLTQVTTPYCGHLRWTYAPYTLSGSRTYYEVQNRYLSMASGAPETAITLVRANDSGYTVHSSAMLQDTPSNAEKIWTFETTAGFNLGLQLSYEELTLSTSTALSLQNFTWSQTPTSLNPYIGTTVTTLDPPQSYTEEKQTTQTLDQHGNLLQMQVYNYAFGAVGTLARTYTNTYLGGSNYTSRYIFNRLLTSTVTDGTNTATLASNSYDQTAIVTQSGGPILPAPPPTILLPGTTVYEHDNTDYPAAFIYRGNVTNSTTPTTTTTNFYDVTGTVVESTVNGVTNVAGTGSTTNYAAPTAVTTNSLNSSMNWTSFLGINSATGPNGDTSSIGYDANARPTTVTSPYGAVTNYTYNDTASPPNKIATTNGHWVKTVMDGFGRTIQIVTGYGTTTVSTVDTQYAPCGCSPMGKQSKQSQPYAPGGGDAWTVYSYDASGRTTNIALPDGSTTTYYYQSTLIYDYDPAGNWKNFALDTFSNIRWVYEPDPALGTVYTGYTYDVSNHLTQVSMPRGSATQTRTFNYNSGTTVTGFLQSATNPENGTVTYTYNANNLLASKTDAKSQKLTYQYDSYNRLSSVTWTNPPQGGAQVLRTYYYDTNPLDTTGFSQYTAGRLAAVKYAGEGIGGTVQINEMYSYTQPFGNIYPQIYGGGLPSAKRLQVNEPMKYQNVQGQNENGTVTGNLDTTFTYNSEGGLISTTYPTTTTTNGNGTIINTPGPTYNYSYDSMYRLSGMTQSTTTIVSNVSYNAANQLLTMNYPAANETRSYNVLNQLTNVTAGSENLTYNYPTGANNGKVSSMYNAVSGETVTYTYDSLNRLLTATGSGWGERYGFDPFGNLLSKTVTAGSGPSMSMSVNTANNELQGTGAPGYDANGNTITNYNGGVTNTLTYDAENRVSTYQPYIGSATTYAYDTQNRRIWMWAGATDTWGNVSGYTVNIYTPSGLKLGAYAVNPAVNDNQAGQAIPFMAVGLTTSDQYFGSRRLAVIDQLGSAGTYFPWGENRGTTNPLNTWSFGTYWEDSLSGLDYANNRYYSNAYGRFMTPDPSGSSQDPKAPQSWNLYPYVTGDPVNFTDPTGLFIQCTSPSVPSSDGSTCVSPDPGGGGAGGVISPGGSSPNPGGAGKNAHSGPGLCPGGTSRMANGPCSTNPTDQSFQNYLNYLTCFFTLEMGSAMSNTDLTYGALTAAVYAARWGSMMAGGVTALVELAYMATQSPAIAKACSQLENYTPWMLQP